MIVGVVGLGEMGGPIAKKLHQTFKELYVYDLNPGVVQEFANLGMKTVPSIVDLSAKCTLIWVMVPAAALDEVLKNLCDCTQKGTVLIDGGNSHYTQTIRRSEELAKRHIHFLDCGTSGGLYGAVHGFSMTIGGEKEIFQKVEEVFKHLAASGSSYSYVGPNGAGHYVKMIHNGIEYALMQSYAEGIHLLHNGHYKNLDLATITQTWMHGAVIRSWLLDIAHDILATDQSLASIKGIVGDNGTGRWTVEEAAHDNVPVKLIKDALDIRIESRTTGGNYATKLVALMRHKMGGHKVTLNECVDCVRF